MSKVTRENFKEVLHPPIWLVAFIYFLLLSLVIAIWAAFTNAIAVIAFIASLIIQALIIHGMTSTIEVRGGELIIGRAHIPVKYLGAATLISRSNFGVERTRGADPAAYFATTFWISEGVKVEVIDERDPTPYWLISSRRGEDLVAALKS